MRRHLFVLLSTALFWLNQSGAFCQDSIANLEHKDYAFLSDDEFQLAKRKNEFLITDSNFTWVEWQGHQDQVPYIQICYKDKVGYGKIHGRLIVEKDTFEIAGTKSLATVWSNDLVGVMRLKSKSSLNEINFDGDPQIVELNLLGKKSIVEVVSSSVSIYSEFEQYLIEHRKSTFFNLDSNGQKNFRTYEYKNDSIQLKFHLSHPNGVKHMGINHFIQGQFCYKSNCFELNGGIVLSDGNLCCASIWEGDIHKGILVWDTYDEFDSTELFFKYCHDQGVIPCSIVSSILVKINEHINNSETAGSYTLRKRQTEIDVQNIHSPTSCTIVLRVLVNENGKVVAAKNKDKTSTDDIELIDQVIKQVKEQVTYEPNSEVTSEIIVVYLKENP